VTLTGPGGGVTGVTRELAAPAEFATAFAPSDPNGRTLAIIPTSPLKQLQSYMVVMTNGIRTAGGTPATPDQTYFLTKRTSPLCTGGASTDPLLPNATACALEPLRQLTNSQLAAASSRGIARDDVVVSWVFTTQSISVVSGRLQGRATAGPTTLVNSGATTAVANLPPIGNIHIGVITLPYYLSAPTAQNPTGPLNGFWKAAPNGYVPPFAGQLNPTSTNITFANPDPVKTTDVTVPVLVTIPNAASGQTKPAAGWPVIIFQHGITRNRLDALAISATAAAQGFAVVAIDQPLHGIIPADDPAFTSPFYVPRTPFAAVARERTFDVDYINNTTGAAGPDGKVDSSGAHTINLASLLTSRDNLRQATADLFVLAKSIPNMDIDANGTGDFDGSRIAFVGQSLGSIVGTPFLALDPTVNVGVLSVPGGGIARMIEASPTFGPRIRAGLAAAGLQPNTPAFDQFLGATQQVLDSADPVNYGIASVNNAILLHEVVGGGSVLPDQVIPNSVAGAPLSGTEPLIKALNLPSITATTQSASGVRGATRFIVGDHGSLLSPAASLPATVEMQGQMISFIASGGAAVVVSNPAVIRTQ
jgi:pimeloyl-ACP methyl ester carboxylesterase